jgi:hypothetical protein
MEILINIAAFLAIPVGAITILAGMASIGRDDATGICLAMGGALIAGAGFVVLSM